MQSNKKHATWKEAIRHVQQLTDKLGMPVDTGIAETVAIMQLMGIHTTMSCGGHYDRITGGPYVVFISKKAEEIRKKCAEISDPRNNHYKKLAHEALLANIRQQQQLYAMLEEFYGDRSTPFSQRLTLRTMGMSACRLECQGAELAYVGNANERKRILEKNSTEMQAFTEFMKEAYFSE